MSQQGVDHWYRPAGPPPHLPLTAQLTAHPPLRPWDLSGCFVHRWAMWMWLRWREGAGQVSVLPSLILRYPKHSIGSEMHSVQVLLYPFHWQRNRIRKRTLSNQERFETVRLRGRYAKRLRVLQSKLTDPTLMEVDLEIILISPNFPFFTKSWTSSSTTSSGSQKLEFFVGLFVLTYLSNVLPTPTIEVIS